MHSTTDCNLVVVDNGSSDETPAIIAAFADRAPFPVIYVREERPGLSTARNAGVRASSGRIVAFTDDDCYPDPDLLDAVRRLFREDGLGYATGRVRLFDPDDFPVTINESCTPVLFPPGCYIAPGAVKGANMVFTREALERIGGFDEDFGSGSYFPAEDCDAAARASLAGYAGRYAPELVVWHHHGRKAADVEKLHRAYDYGRGAYHMKMLVKGSGLGPRLRGWMGLPRRILHRPASLYWELAGAVRFIAVSAGARYRP
jgi:GT2 family glycosyltransferase